MMRRIPALVILLAVLFAAEPLFHSHPLSSEDAAATSTTKCVVCISGTSQLPSVAPSIAVATTVIWTIEPAVTPAGTKSEPIPAPSRAPPAL